MGFANIQLACEGPHSSILTEEMYARVLSVISSASWATRRVKYADWGSFWDV